MSEVRIVGLDIRGASGTRLPARCAYCGPTEISVPFTGMSSLILADTSHECLKCGRQIRVDSAFYQFFSQTVDILKDAKLTRQQVRRFERATKKDPEASILVETAGRINPQLAEATKLAQKQPNPKSAIATIIAISKIVLALGSSITAFGAGVITADEVWDRWNKGELFENHSSPSSEQVQKGLDEKASDKGRDHEN